MSALEQLVDEIAEKVAARVLPRVLAALGSRDDGEVETIEAFAARYGWTKRHVGNLIRRGLPSVGAKQGRRIRSRAADAWLASGAHADADDGDAIAAAAVAAARRPTRARR